MSLKFDDLIHDLNSLRYKLGILTPEITKEDLENKTQAYQDLVGTLKDATEILEKIK